MSEEREGQILHDRGKTTSYCLSLIIGISIIIRYFWFTFDLPLIDPFYKLILLLVSFILVITSLAFAYMNMNILRNILKIISGFLALIHVLVSFALFWGMGVFMIIWYSCSLILIFNTFKWLRESEQGGWVSSILRKNFSYYTCLVLGIIFFRLYIFYIVRFVSIDLFHKMTLVVVSILLVITSLRFAYLKTRRVRILMTVVSGSLAGILGYLSLALFTGAGVYMFGWVGFSILLIFAAFNWLKE